MTDNKIFEGVGKKIVDALKQQSEIEFQPQAEDFEPINKQEENNIQFSSDFNPEPIDLSGANNLKQNYTAPMNFTYQQPLKEKELFASELDSFEIPTNVAVLKQLINQLPAGVSKQTGAQIIKQTMEALGISMKSVLQEAQQVQEGLNQTARECQTSIIEYRKQIGVLENQVQRVQRQSAALNDIVSLFVQTNI